MDNNNPAEMSNQDLENDMQNNAETKGNQEKVSKSSAAEGTLKTPEQDKSSKAEVDSQDGSMPDPEALDNWETNDEDINKISG